MVTSKVWKWKPKQHEYGYVIVKSTKYICKREVTSNLAEVGCDNLVQLEFLSIYLLNLFGNFTLLLWPRVHTLSWCITQNFNTHYNSTATPRLS